MVEWKDDGEMDYFEYLQKVAEETGAAIEAGDPDNDLAYLSEGIEDYLKPYTTKALQDILEEDPTLDPNEVAKRLHETIMPLIKQFTLDKMNAVLLRDGYYDPVNKILQTRFPPNSVVDSAEFVYIEDDKGEHFGLKYLFKDGTFMFFDSEMLERVNQVIIDKGGMSGYVEDPPIPDISS